MTEAYLETGQSEKTLDALLRMDWTLILTFGVEGLGLLVYVGIMVVLTAARTTSLRTQFYTQSWIIGSFDISCYLGNVALRLVRDYDCGIELIYPTMIFTKMATNGHELTMIWLNIMRFQVLYKPTTGGDSSRATFKRRLYWAGVVWLFAVGLSAYRIVLIFLIGWPNLNYNYPDALLMLFIRSGTVGILLVPCAFCALLNILSFVLMMRKTAEIMSSAQRRRNFRMLAYAASIIVSAFPITAYQSLKFYGTMADNKQLTTEVTRWFDLCYFPYLFGSPICTLALSVDVRREFVRLLTCRWRTSEVHGDKELATTHHTTLHTTRLSVKSVPDALRT